MHFCGYCTEVCPELAIVHGQRYENASEQRAHFTLKEDILTQKIVLKWQIDCDGFGSVSKDADKKIKKITILLGCKMFEIVAFTHFNNINVFFNYSLEPNNTLYAPKFTCCWNDFISGFSSYLMQNFWGVVQIVVYSELLLWLYMHLV